MNLIINITTAARKVFTHAGGGSDVGLSRG